MAQDSIRHARRIAYAARTLLRGARGEFESYAGDISRVGIRLVVSRDTIGLTPDVDLAGASACVQTRLGSRFSVELGLTADGRGLVRKVVELVRLSVDPEALELGCRFAIPMSASESEALELELPRDGDVPGARVRRTGAFSDEDRSPVDPALAEAKVERLFETTVEDRLGAGEGPPPNQLRILIRAARAERGAAPLLGVAAELTEATVSVWIPGDVVSGLGCEAADLASLARHLLDEYGEWPLLEIMAADQRRLWHGKAHVSGLEMDDVPTLGITLRLAFSRRLQPTELKRLTA